MSIHEDILKRLNDLYKTTEKGNDDNDKINQSANSVLNNEREVHCYKINHTVKVNITLKCKICHLRFCFTCLSEEIQNRYNKTRDCNVILKCLNENCSSIIEFYSLKQIIPQQLFLSLQEELLNPKPKPLIHTESVKEKKLSQSLDTKLCKLDSEIICEVCFETKKFQDCLNLECNHIFCKKCLQQDLTLKINYGQIDKSFIKCMKTDCGQEIKYYTLKNFLDEKTFEKYDHFLFELTMMSFKQKGEYTVICPNIKCRKTSYIWEGAPYFECTNCLEKYCTNENCKGNWKQHEGNTCVQFKNLNILDSAEPVLNSNNMVNYNKESGPTSMNIVCTFCKETHAPYSIFSDNQLNFNGSIYFCQSKQQFICSLCNNTIKKEKINDHLQYEKSQKEKEILEKEKDIKNSGIKCFNSTCKNNVISLFEPLPTIESTRCSICLFVHCNNCKNIYNNLESGKKHFDESHKQK